MSEAELIPEFTILGPGALGLLFAGLLAEKGAKVALLDRDLERGKRIEKAGVKVSGPGAAPERSMTVSALAAPPDCGFVLVAVKAHADAAVVERLRGLPACVTVVTLGNGLGRVEALAPLGADRVLLASTTEGATLEGEGRVRHAGRGVTRVAPLEAAGERRAEKLVRRLAALGLEARVEADARALAWEKVTVNAAINAIAGLLDVPNGALLTNAAASSLADRAAEEAARVAAALAVPGDWSPERAKARWRAVAAATAPNLCSTVQDLRGRRKSEVHAINGAIAEAARMAGVATPTNELLAVLIAAREELG
ncbi:MAG: ketopantoate reductase family protein [Planctomycetota bacterium]